MNVAPAPARFPYIQALRAIAAAMVAFDHVAHDLLAVSPAKLPVLAACWRVLPWQAGVDVFFAISGFVIAHATTPLFGTPGGPARFLARRLVRVVPLYWVATTLFLAALAVLPGAIHGELGGWGFVARSYLFIPARRPDGLIEPVFGLGWTLDFEMLFYVVLAPFVRLPRPVAVAGTVLVLALLVAAGARGLVGGTVLGTWASPIVLEFCAGMGVATLAGRVRLAGLVRAALAVAAVAILALAPPWLPRPLAWGGPAVLLVAAATLGGDGRHPAFEHVLERWGDASYALYLVHPIAMRPATLLWHHLALRGDLAAFGAVAVELAAAQAAALLVHRRIERPLTRRLRALGTFI